jgi:hypothetical protein
VCAPPKIFSADLGLLYDIMARRKGQKEEKKKSFLQDLEDTMFQ